MKYSFEKVKDTISPVIKNPDYYKCKVTLLNSYPERANAIRRILLDEIPSPALCCANAVISTNDSTLSVHAIKHRIEMIKPLDMADNGVYGLKIKNPNSSRQSVFSHHISNKLVPYMLICDLAPDCSIEISGIKVRISTGIEHANFSAVFRNVQYKELDFHYVRKVNDAGFIENNRFPVAVKFPKNSVITKKNVKIRKEDQKLFASLKPIETEPIIKDCANYEITFCSYYNPELVLNKLNEVYKKNLESALDYELEVNNGEYSFTFTGSHTAANEIKKFLPGNVYGDSLPFVNGEKYKITIFNVDAVNIYEKVVKNLLSQKLF